MITFLFSIFIAASTAAVWTRSRSDVKCPKKPLNMYAAELHLTVGSHLKVCLLMDYMKENIQGKVK